MPPSAPLFVAAHRHVPGATVMTLRGELDTNTCAELDAYVRRYRPPGDHLLLDLTDLTYLDSAGLRILIDIQRRIQPEGVTLRLAALQRVPSRLMAITGARAAIPIHSTLEQAVSFLLAATRTRRHNVGETGEAPA